MFIIYAYNGSDAATRSAVRKICSTTQPGAFIRLTKPEFEAAKKLLAFTADEPPVRFVYEPRKDTVDCTFSYANLPRDDYESVKPDPEKVVGWWRKLVKSWQK